MRSLETPRVGVRIRQFRQILRFAFTGSGDHAFVPNVYPSVADNKEFVFSWILAPECQSGHATTGILSATPPS